MELRFSPEVEELKQGIAILQPLLKLPDGEGAVDIRLVRTHGAELSVAYDGERKAEIVFCQDIHFFRGLGILAQQLRGGKAARVEETCFFTTNGIMFDVSQGSAVILPEAMERILQRMALMGLSMLMIYMEDTYVLRDHPYFGYMRPQYTMDDLKRIDDYAAQFGIEVIPCVQSLAHLIDVIKWPAYGAFADTEDILMVGDDRTYAFVEDCIREIMKPFRTKRIHIGMDEAWKIGRGNYQDRHGLRDKHSLMKEHLDRVYKITQKYGLEPMMWSDMFFNTPELSGYGNNYDPGAPISDAIKKQMPEKLGMVFWEYNRTDEAFYDQVIARHQEFGNRVYFAGGVYNCFGFGVNTGLAYRTIEASLSSCKRMGVKDVFLTVWGDDTTENNVFSLMQVFQYYAEHCYADAVDPGSLPGRFAACCDGTDEDFMALRYLDEIPGISADYNKNMCNPSKWLLWQHPMYGLFDKNIEGLNLGEHYAKLAPRFREAIQRNPAYRDVFDVAEALCEVLSVKADLGNRMRRAYLAGDRDTLRRIMETDLPSLLEKYRLLRVKHRDSWFRMNKPEGFDVIELRYGTQLTWLDTAVYRLDAYLSNRVDSLVEFEKERVSYPADAELPFVNRYSRMVSASRPSHSDTYSY